MAKRMVARAYGSPLEVLELDEVDVPAPGPGEVTIAVKAAGVNPADAKTIMGAWGADPAALPLLPGFEVAGVIGAIGPETVIATGRAAIGDPVVAFRVTGGYTQQLTAKGKDVFAKPKPLGFAEASGLLLTGTTAADMLRAAPVGPRDTVMVHGASGAVGASLLQQLVETGARVVGTGREDRLEQVGQFGARPVAYGPGLLARLVEAAPEGYTAAFDTSGVDESIDACLELVTNRRRIVTIAAMARAAADGFVAVGGKDPVSSEFRDQVRGKLIEMADAGRLIVPMDRTFPLEHAGYALEYGLAGPHGKVALTM